MSIPACEVTCGPGDLADAPDAPDTPGAAPRTPADRAWWYRTMAPAALSLHAAGDRGTPLEALLEELYRAWFSTPKAADTDALHESVVRALHTLRMDRAMRRELPRAGVADRCPVCRQPLRPARTARRSA